MLCCKDWFCLNFSNSISNGISYDTLLLLSCLLSHRVSVNEEKANEQACNRQNISEQIAIAKNDGWRPIDRKKERFLIRELPPEKSFLSLKHRVAGNRPATYFILLRKFITDELISHLIENFDERDTTMNSRKYRDEYGQLTSVGYRKLKLCPKYAWQALAVQVRITGRQSKSKENKKIIDPLKTNITEAMAHFNSISDINQCVGRNTLEKYISLMLLTEDFAEEISKNFFGLVLSLGQHIAGDEKLWGFTGNSSKIRLVLSKPDRLGFWFYELCAPLMCGLPYLLKLSMHNSLKKTLTTDSIVQGWISVLKEVGKDSLPVGENPNPNCYISFDSYYLAATSVQSLKDAL